MRTPTETTTDKAWNELRNPLKALHRWQRNLYSLDRHTVHKVSAMAHIGWTVGLIVNPVMFSSNAALAPLAFVAPEWFWAVWSLLLAICQIAGLGGFGLTMRRERAAELVGSYASVMWWSWIAFMFSVHGNWSTAEGTYLTLAFSSIWAARYVPHPSEWPHA